MTLLLTVGTYILLWSPYWFLSLVVVDTTPLLDALPCIADVPWYVIDYRLTAVTWLMYTSLSVNPLVYGLMNRVLRSEIKAKMRSVGRYLSRCVSHAPAANGEHGAGTPENFW